MLFAILTAAILWLLFRLAAHKQQEQALYEQELDELRQELQLLQRENEFLAQMEARLIPRLLAHFSDYQDYLITQQIPTRKKQPMQIKIARPTYWQPENEPESIEQPETWQLESNPAQWELELAALRAARQDAPQWDEWQKKRQPEKAAYPQVST
ncbi:hypothetical protein [Kingella oralis]|jgi:hypothetical protein|uniref:Uncharacterized protein n=1 Tax=Kingella oralis ATCC 51147 TaxID=629741 RepID=C4GIX8_9NEIS|nr:hypothetical protein [Kingella oralis]EEP67750.1 hypothetical protein GCWU000324_02000 [Kingella oralis ATCC 51147]QMT43407.1 hypothetical protein H3L93_03455 [Kingella oralis]